jgi:murein L,D-transpeptidase YcbB/YkuD
MIGFEIRINNREPVIITSYDVAFVMVNCNYSFDDNIYRRDRHFEQACLGR